MDTSGGNAFGFDFFSTASADQLKAVFDAFPSSVVIVNADGQFLYVNKKGLELYGIDYSGYDMSAYILKVKALKPNGEPFPLEDMPVSHSLKHGQAVRNVEMIIENVHQVRYSVLVSSSPLLDHQGNINGAVVVFEDISGRRQQEKDLNETTERLAQSTEDKYRMLFHSIDEGFFLIDVIFDENDKPIDMYYAEANEAAVKMLGCDYTGRRLREINPDYEEYWFEIFGRVALTGKSVRMEQYAEPDKKWYSFYIFRIGDEKSRRIGNIFLDITERKKTEEALRASEERLRALTVASTSMIYRMNPDWSSMTKLYSSGFLAETNKPDMSWLDKYIRPEDQAFVTGKIHECIREKKLFELEHRVLQADGSIGWTYSRAIPILDEKGEIKNWFGTASDITDRKQMEEALRESDIRAHELVRELEEADKNKNEFLNALAHELRNPLATISAGLQLLDITQDPNQAAKAKGIMKRQMSHLCYLIDDLLDLTRISHNKIELRKEVIELNSLALSVADDNRLLYEVKGVKLITDIKCGPLIVNADPTRIKQIIGNLLTNALKFAKTGGETLMLIYTENSESVICVKDNGIGIEPDMLQNLFIPFIQADTSFDRRNGGLGLGLSIAKGIAELHGGSVSAFSEGLGKGSKFTIKLPLQKKDYKVQENIE